MYTYQITDVARREHEANCKIVNEAAGVLGLDESYLWTQAQEKDDFHTKDSVLLQMLADRFGSRFYNSALHHDEIKGDHLLEDFSEDQIEAMYNEEYLEKIDTDEDLLIIIDEAFNGFGDIFDIDGTLHEKVRALPNKIKDYIWKLGKHPDRDFSDKANQDSLMEIRGIVLQELGVISPRKIRITEE